MRRSKKRVHPENITEQIRRKDRRITRTLYYFLFGTLIVGCAV
jgi:hypothetical protein